MALMSNGANTDSKDVMNKTPLDYATENHHSDSAQQLETFARLKDVNDESEQ